MSQNTKIEWADHTFNPWIGCTKVGPGCDNCYAKVDFDDRKHRVTWGAGQARSRTKTWGDPVKWNKQHEAFGIEHGRKQRVFCASLADVFDNEVDPQWRHDLFDLIRATPHLHWLLLTKRIGNVLKMLPSNTSNGPAEMFAEHYPNVWIGATICNQEEADRDITKLMAVPAAQRFLSLEPLLGPVDLGFDLPWRTPHVDWVIVGGESGPNARPMHPDWVRSLRDQCQAAGVPFLFNQHGEWIGVPDLRNLSGSQGPGFGVFDSCAYDQIHEAVRVGKKSAGRLLDGREWNGVPS
jgi:protein gp37